ncbi:Glyco_hydro_114 domain-containing protein [Agreia sp. COWG]|nr:Glyco_hydro_114 domain-containing protein [Agreia sp. COWG]
MRAGALTAAVLAVALAAGGCAPVDVVSDSSDAGGPAVEVSPVAETPGVLQPPFGKALDYQLGGSYPVANGVGLVTRDSTAMPETGVYSVCYVNGFQSQPGDDDRWLTGAPDLVLRGADGHPVVDENWPDEFILDASSSDKRERIFALVKQSISACAESGFDAVEIDNLDSYSRSGGRLSIDDALALARLYVDDAHSLDLAIGQKNSAEIGDRGRSEAGFDFAVTEECMRFEECPQFEAVYGDAVMDIEYADDLPDPFAEICASPDRPATTTLRDRDLVAKGESGYVFEHC